MTTAVQVETASWARRIVALLVDWMASTLVVVLIIGSRGWAEDPLSSVYVLGVYVVQNALLTASAGGSFGKLATRLRVVRATGDPRPPDLIRSLVRALMIAVVIPPLVFRPDGRGLHDMFAGTATVTLQEFRALAGR